MKQKTKKIHYHALFSGSLFLTVLFVCFFAFGVKTVSATVTCNERLKYNDEDVVYDPVTGEYAITMNHDMDCNTGDAVHLGDTGDDNTKRLVLDCNDHVLYQVSIDTCDTFFCRENFEIRNCTFYYFQSGNNAISIDPGITNSRIDNVTIKNNTFYEGDATTRAIWADFGFGANGQNNIIEHNNIMNIDTTPFWVIDMGEGSEIRYNRSIVKTGESGGGYVGLKVDSSENISIHGNYLDCHKYTNEQLGGDRCDLDLQIESATGPIDVYDNVFAGRGAIEHYSTHVDWCPSGLKRNIFADKGTVDLGGEWVIVPTGACPKTCYNDSTNPIPSNGEFSENSCIDKDVYYSTDRDVAIKPTADNVIVLCGANDSQSTDIFTGDINRTKSVGIEIGDLDKDNGYGEMADNGIADNPRHVSIIGCNFTGYKEYAIINNSYDAYLQDNVFSPETDEWEDTEYYLHVNSEPFNILDYKHEIYDPFTALNSSHPYRLYWDSIINKIDVPIGSEPTKSVVYYHNVYFGNGQNIYGYNTIDGDDETFDKVGHITISKARGVLIQNMDYDHGDPITLVDVSPNPNYGTFNYRIEDNEVVRNYHKSFDIMYSEDLVIQRNSSTDSIIGFSIATSSRITMTSNVARSTREDSYGAQFLYLTDSVIGSETDESDGNTFTDNKEAGAYIRGTYQENSTNPRDDGMIFGFNTFSLNGLWGVIAEYLSAYRFINNTISMNGVLDDCIADGFDANCTGLTPQCNDGIDNDKDGFTDFTGGDPECGAAEDMSEGYSPGFYLNSSYNSLLDENDISGNSGDNIYVDATKLRNDDNQCPVSNVAAMASQYNIFINNTFNNSVHGSGAMLVNGSVCTNGNVTNNNFGYFYLNSNARTGYTTSPGTEEFFNYIKPSVIGGSLPVSGNNTFNFNAVDGLTVSWANSHAPTAYRVENTDIFDNKIQGNARYGIYNYGYPATVIHNIKSDIIKNEIFGNEGGILLESTYYSRVFGNDIHGNSEFGIKIENDRNISQISTNYVEVGYDGGYGSTDYQNTLTANVIGIGVDNFDYTKIIDNSLTTHQWGIHATSSNSLVIQKNVVNGYTRDGIGTFLSNFSIIDSNQIKNGTTDNAVGLNVVNSKNLVFDCSNVNTIVSVASPGQYMYIGPELSPISHPYPSDDIKDYYDHTDMDCSCGNPNKCANVYKLNDADTAKPLYYYYTNGGTITYNSDWLNSKHLQIVGAANFDLDFGSNTLNDFDPVHFAYLYSDGGTAEVIENVNIQNCRGDCMILYNLNFDTVGIKNITLQDINFDTATQNAIEGYFLEDTILNSLTIQDVNTSNGNEQGGVYLYNNKNLNFQNTAFEYPGGGKTQKQWDLYLGGRTQNNFFIGNYFGNPTEGSGAWESRPGFDAKAYINETVYPVQNDNFCLAANDDGFCDYNCIGTTTPTTVIDNDCSTEDFYLDGKLGCRNTQGDCCKPTSDGVVDPDCLPGVDPDSAAISYIADDGICVSNGSGCDVNCTLDANTQCSSGANPSKPNNYCHPAASDLVCDYDCPPGLDPDCTAENNTWCTQTPTVLYNTWNLQSGFDKPNYYFPLEGSQFISGWGGIPNDAYACEIPASKVRFPSNTAACEGAACIRQISDYRDETWQNRSNAAKKFWVYMDFADSRGLSQTARILDSDTKEGTYLASTGSGISTYLSALQIFGPGGNPDIVNNTYPIGDFTAIAISTPDIDDEYVGFSWADADNSLFTRIKTEWDAKNQLVTADCTDGKHWARLEAYNSLSQISRTESSKPAQEHSMEFDCDFTSPVIGNFNVVSSNSILCLRDGVDGYNGTSDTYIKGTGDNTVNYGNAADFWVDGYPNDRDRAALIKWDVSSIGAGSSIVSASTTFYITDFMGDEYEIYEMKRNWVEGDGTAGSGATWNTYNGSASWGTAGAQNTTNDRGNTSFCDAGLCFTGALNSYKTIPFNSAGVAKIQAWVNTPSTNYGIIIQDYDDSADSGGAAASSDAATVSRRPQLCIEYDTPGLNTYIITWDAVTEPSWTDGANQAHYEIWFGEDQTEVQNRTESTGGAANGPFVWDDTGAWPNMPYEPNCTWGGGGDDNCFDSDLDVKGTLTTTLKTNINANYMNFCVVDDYGNETCSYVALIPFIETQYGNVYTGGRVGSDVAQPTSRAFSTFLILANGQIQENWDTAIGNGANFETDNASGFTSPFDAQGKARSYGQINFPKESNQYTTSIGSLEYLAHSVFSDSNPATVDIVQDLKNQYGSERVKPISTLNDISGGLLNGKIYYSVGNLTVSSPSSFIAGTGNQVGSGLIIVNGDLHINADITYSGDAAKITNIPSVGWIVLGDIFFDQNVTHSVGAFMALGKKGAAACPDFTAAENGCGRISTGDGISKLTIEGLLFARQLHLERVNSNTSEASELVIYDGRILANTPLGLEDFVNGLPIWLEDLQ